MATTTQLNDLIARVRGFGGDLTVRANGQLQASETPGRPIPGLIKDEVRRLAPELTAHLTPDEPAGAQADRDKGARVRKYTLARMATVLRDGKPGERLFQPGERPGEEFPTGRDWSDI